MTEVRIRSFADLHEVLGRHRRDAGWSYRGHADPDWDLVPPAGRAPLRDGHDEIFFRRWMAEAKHYLPDAPRDDWEWLAIAQQYGFATRLLGWTSKPLAAVYFAVAEPGDRDAVVYAFKSRSNLVAPADRPPFKYQGIHQFAPRHVSPGLSRQIALFTLHGPPTLSLDEGRDSGQPLERFVIDRGYRDELRFELNQYGVNRQTLFPDLSGLSRQFRWIQESFDYWAEGLSKI